MSGLGTISGQWEKGLLYRLSHVTRVWFGILTLILLRAIVFAELIQVHRVRPSSVRYNGRLFSLVAEPIHTAINAVTLHKAFLEAAGEPCTIVILSLADISENVSLISIGTCFSLSYRLGNRIRATRMSEAV